VQQRVMRLAVLADAVGETLEAPIFILGDLAAALGEDFGQRSGEVFDLLLGNVLARQEDMLVKGHECAFLRGSNTQCLARSLLEAGKASKQSCKEREHGRPGTKPCSATTEPSVQPPAKRIAGVAIGEKPRQGKKRMGNGFDLDLDSATYSGQTRRNRKPGRLLNAIILRGHIVTTRAFTFPGQGSQAVG